MNNLIKGDSCGGTFCTFKYVHIWSSLIEGDEQLDRPNNQ